MPAKRGVKPASSRDVDTRCRSGTEKGAGAQSGSNCGAFPLGRSCRIGDGFVDQQNRNIVPNRIDAPALGALQAFSVFLEQQRFFAHGADQDVQQILRNHARILRLWQRAAQSAGAVLVSPLVRRRKATLTSMPPAGRFFRRMF
jgi:hypothetical protein